MNKRERREEKEKEKIFLEGECGDGHRLVARENVTR
jgi:hypothetical protein